MVPREEWVANSGGARSSQRSMPQAKLLTIVATAFRSRYRSVLVLNRKGIPIRCLIDSARLPHVQEGEHVRLE